MNVQEAAGLSLMGFVAGMTTCQVGERMQQQASSPVNPAKGSSQQKRLVPLSLHCKVVAQTPPPPTQHHFKSACLLQAAVFLLPHTPHANSFTTPSHPSPGGSV